MSIDVSTDSNNNVNITVTTPTTTTNNIGVTSLYGPKGDKGDKGDTGEAATIQVGSTTTGEAGTEASVTNSGTSSAAIFNFTIPRGAKGDPGDVSDVKVDGVSVVTSGVANIENTGKILQVAFEGTLENTIITFEPTTAYDLKENYEYEVDLTFPVSGTLDDNYYMRILNGSNYVTFVNALDYDEWSAMTIGDMKQLSRYYTTTGYRWLFRAVYKVTSSHKLFLIYPVVSNDTRKQNTLVSGTNIKTINSNSILGSGNLDIDGLPSQTGHAGEFLTTNGTLASWATASTYHPPLFDCKWSDHLINNISWLRSDTFSWQSGSVYTTAYNHLVTDISGITAETETIGSYTVTFYRATDGHKICLSDQETTVSNIYTESGIAWYYILDTTNTQFKLPRDNSLTHGELIDKGVSNSIYYRVYQDGYCEQWGTASPGSANLTISFPKIFKDTDYSFNRSNQSSNNTTATNWAGEGYKSKTTSNVVMHSDSNYTTSLNWEASGYLASGQYNTDNTGKRYLYFYVGEYSQTATEQTAGLNAELFNNKVDLNAANLSTAGKTLISGLGMPSSRYTDLTLGATGSTYTAPANGWFYLMKTSSGSGQWLNMSNDTFVSIDWSSNTGQVVGILFPCIKDDTITVSYSVGGTTVTFRFIYAEGNPSS